MKISHILWLGCILMASVTSGSGQVVVVGHPYMKILYRNIENPIVVAVENHSCSDIVLRASHGELLQNDDCKYTLTIHERVREVHISVGLLDADSVRWIEREAFRVRSPEFKLLVLPQDDFDLSDTTGLYREYGYTRQWQDNDELQVVIQPVLTRVFYKLADNPFDIVVEGFNADQIVASARYGTISYSKDRPGFMYSIDECADTMEVITVGMLEDSGIRWLRRVPFPLLDIPQPELYISGLRGGNIDKARLLTTPVVWIAGTTTVHVYPPYKVESYAAIFIRNDSVLYADEKISGNRFPPELLELIENASPGDQIIINQVNASGARDKCWKEFPEVVLTIQ
jgi:hypothetical protein